MITKHDSSTRVLTFVLTVAFGLVAAVIAYATFKGGSFQLRSKAAQEEVVLRQWTFDANEEGWAQKDFAGGVVRDGVYQLMVNPQKQVPDNTDQCRTVNGRQLCTKMRVMRELVPQIGNTAVKTHLKYPVNKFRIRLSASLAGQAVQRFAGNAQVDKMAGSGGVSAPQPATPFTLKISQKYQGKQLADTEQQISAVADGKEHEYSFEFSKESSLKQVDELQIIFVGLNGLNKGVVSINDIALIGLREVPVKPVPPQKPPQPRGQTYNGYVRRYTTDAKTRQSQYKLEVVNYGGAGMPVRRDEKDVAISKGTVYVLAQNNTNPCGEGKYAQMMCRYIQAPTKTNFEQYVDKFVSVTGTVVDAKANSKDDPREQRRTVEGKGGVWVENNPSDFPTLIVSTIKVSDVGLIPEQRPPTPSDAYCVGKNDGTVCGGTTACPVCPPGVMCKMSACIPTPDGVCMKNTCVSKTPTTNTNTTEPQVIPGGG